MTLARTAQKRDANEPDIVKALREVGCSVDLLPGGDGRMDLLIGVDGIDIKMEIKMPGEKLNAKQMQYHREWRGAHIHLAWSVEQALDIVAWCRKTRRKP